MRTHHTPIWLVLVACNDTVLSSPDSVVPASAPLDTAANHRTAEASFPHIDQTPPDIGDPERLGIASDDFYGVYRDSDRDGLYDHVERQRGLDPHEWDSDLDSLGDHWEILGSRRSQQRRGQTAWFQHSPGTLQAPPPDAIARFNAPLFGVHVNNWNDGKLVLFGTDTGRPLVIHGTNVFSDIYIEMVHADVSDAWPGNGHLEIRVASWGTGIGFLIHYELFELDVDESGEPTERRLGVQYHLPLDPPTGRPIRGVYGPDTDGDYLLDQKEFLYGTDPFVWDTDGDSIPDGVEVYYGHNPLSEDTDGDGILDMDEYLAGTADIMPPHPQSGER